MSIPSGAASKLDLPSSNVLWFVPVNGRVTSARPRGTEPKIKFYFSLAIDFKETEHYDSASDAMQFRVAVIKKELSL